MSVLFPCFTLIGVLSTIKKFREALSRMAKAFGLRKNLGSEFYAVKAHVPKDRFPDIDRYGIFIVLQGINQD